MENLELFGIALMPVIAGLVELLKRSGMPSRLAPWAVTGLSATAVIVIGYVGINPESSGAVEFALNLLIYVLGSIGLYEGVRWAKATDFGFSAKRDFEVVGE